MTGARIEPTVEALNARPLPDWYDAAKFGIFIHWGVWTIPAFAPNSGSISDVYKTDYDRAVALTPYTEWYANAIKVPGTPSAEFHQAEFGGAPYEAFREPFLAQAKAFDAAAWAEAFRDAGARYVVLVTKHHDGYCLWPSKIANRNQANWTSERDFVAELAAAVRAVGLRFGVYYSGGIDWTFNREPLRTLGDFMASTPTGKYLAYADAQTRELIDRYDPSVLWNDISWPAPQDDLNRLFADYYAAVPDGVVNDRWTCPSLMSKAIKLKPARRALDARIKAEIAKNPDRVQGVIPPEVPHSDFRTPEYARFPDIQAKKWEATRGMSHSFGFNRNDGPDDYASADSFIEDFVDGVSKNGNLLLNVGPRADASIPEPQAERLKRFGAWLRTNGAAIYGTRPWGRFGAARADGGQARFTVSPDGALNIVLTGAPAGGSLRLSGVRLAGQGRRLDDGSPVEAAADGPDTELRFRAPLSGAFAPVVRLEGLAAEAGE